MTVPVKNKNKAYDYKTVIRRDIFHSAKWAQMMDWNPNVAKDVVPLSVADMELQNAPEIKAGLKKYIDEAIFGYTITPSEYQDAVVNWMERRHDWTIDPSWIVNTPGVVTALAESVLSFTKPQEGVIIFTPVYYPFSMVIEANGRKVVRCPLIEENLRYRIDFDAFEKAAADPNNTMLMFCSPHNPVGRVWTREELERLVAICLKHDLFLVSDEIHHDLIMPGYKHTVADVIDPKMRAKLIVCTAPSKTFNLAGLHVSTIVIPNEEVRTRFQDQMAKTALRNINMLAYKACEIAYNECESWLDGAIALFDTNQRLVRDFFAEHFPHIKAPLIEGTYLQWLDFRALGMEAEALETFMHEKAMFFTDEGYIFGDEGRGFERINLALPTHALKTQLEYLKKALKAL